MPQPRSALGMAVLRNRRTQVTLVASRRLCKICVHQHFLAQPLQPT